jgi:hypothetical protein
MKVLCAISGIEFQCEHFPATLTSRETTHPIFHLKQKKLLAFTSKWSAGELTPTDSLLLFLALLNSTDLIDWRVPVQRTTMTDALVANNMEALVHAVGALNVIKNPALAVPSFAVTSDTKTLDNIHYWIQAWHDGVKTFKSGYRATSEWQLLRNREAVLERLIKTSTRQVESYAGILADWAELAGSFPKFDITDYAGSQVSIADYWKLIIRKCCKSESIIEIPKNDLLELIEHCEDTIQFGSIYSYELMKLLRAGLERQTGFLGVDFSKTDFVILDADTSVEDANKLSMMQNAPAEKPVESNYPTKFAYLKAKLSYDMATEYQKNLATQQGKIDSNLPSEVPNNNIHTSVGEL